MLKIFLPFYKNFGKYSETIRQWYLLKSQTILSVNSRETQLNELSHTQNQHIFYLPANDS